MLSAMIVATIGIADCVATDRLGDHDNAAGIFDNSTGFGNDAAGIVDITAKVIPC